MRYDIVGLGLCTHDYLAVVPHMPAFETGVKMLQSDEQGGGPASTGVAAASRLGAQCAFLARVGDDTSGRFIVNALQQDGVDTSRMLTEPNARSHVSLVMVEACTGSRAFITNDASVTPLQPRDLDEEVIARARILHLDDSQPQASLAAARIAKKHGVLVLLDSNAVREHTVELLQYVDVFIPARFFYPDFTDCSDPEDALDVIAGCGPSEIVITLGEEGCVGVDAEGKFSLPAFSVNPVVDTTGCGDVFHGAYAYAKLQNWKARSCAQFASAVAALKCRKLGGRRGIPTIQETMQFLEENTEEWRPDVS